MGNRLSRIYTRTGDTGTTGLGDGTRTDKDGVRVEAYGTVDELNSLLGLLMAELDLDTTSKDASLISLLSDLQHDLFDLGAELCVPGHSVITADYSARLESHIDRLNAPLPFLKEFILPGGNRAAATCHLARTVCRRAERRVLSLGRAEQINNECLVYLNRLSDLLFVIARIVARAEGGKEVLWDRQRGRN